MFTFYIAKAAANFGLAATRPIYEKAIQVLPDKQTAEMCLRFAVLERKLGEIDRARAIFAHGSQFCDPRVSLVTSSSLNAALTDCLPCTLRLRLFLDQSRILERVERLEIETGSEDTFREMRE